MEFSVLPEPASQPEPVSQPEEEQRVWPLVSELDDSLPVAALPVLLAADARTVADERQVAMAANAVQ